MSRFGSDDSSYTSTFSSDLNKDNVGNVDHELQEFLMIEKQKAQFNAQIHEFNDFCWNMCMPQRFGNKLESRTETCLTNCVERFIDVSLFITNRFAMSLQKSAKMLN